MTLRGAQLPTACGHIGPISLREGPIAGDIRPYGPNHSTTYGGADNMVLRTILHLAFGEMYEVK